MHVFHMVRCLSPGPKCKSNAWSSSNFLGPLTIPDKLNVRWDVLGCSAQLKKMRHSGLIKKNKHLINDKQLMSIYPVL